MLISAGYSGPKEISYLFIDGGYFREVVESISKEFYGGEIIPINFESLQSSFTKIFYYDCPHPQQKGESASVYQIRREQQKKYFDSIRFLNGYHLYEGVTSGEGGKARQKQVDIKIAVDMLQHSYRRNMHEATLLTGDLDFKPLIDALVQDGMYVTLWYEEKSTNNDLIYSADRRRILNILSVCGFATEDFRMKHPLPQSWNEKGKFITDEKPMQLGTGINGEIMELYKKGVDYILIFPNSKKEDFFYHTHHGDLVFLEKYHKSMFFDFKWND